MTKPQKVAESTLETPTKPPKKARRGTRLPTGPLWKKVVDSAAPSFTPPDTPPPPIGTGQASPLESASGEADTTNHATPTENEPRETMQTEAPTIKAEPATVITTTVHAAAAPEVKPSMLESLFGPKKSAVAVYVHPTDPLTGRRMTAIMVIPQDEEPEVTTTRLAALKPGTYTIIEKNGTQIVNTTTHVVEASGGDGREASAVTVHHPAQPMDINSLLMGMQSIMRESQAANNEAMVKMQMENLRSQNELLQTMMKARGDTVAAASGMPPEIMQMLIAKAFAPAPSALSQLKELQQMQNMVGGTDEGPFDKLASGLGPVLAAIVAQTGAAGKAAPAPVRTVKVGGAIRPPSAAVPAAPSSIAAPGDPVPPAPADEPTSQEQFEQLVKVVEGMARRGVDAESAIVALSALMEPAEFDQIAALLSFPGALDQLTTMAPSLAPHRDWLEALAEAIKSDPGPVPAEGAGA